MNIRRRVVQELQTFLLDTRANDATYGFIQAKHIKEDTANLWEIKTSDGSASCNICLEDVRKDFDIIRTSQHIQILGSLTHE